MHVYVHVTHFNGYQASTMGKFLFPRHYSTPFTKGERRSQQMVEKKGIVLHICMLCPNPPPPQKNATDIKVCN